MCVINQCDDKNEQIKNSEYINFSIANSVEKVNKKTKYGILTINNIQIDPSRFENYIKELILQEKTLEFIFNDKIENNPKKEINMIKRFLPTSKPENLEEFIEKNCENASFYSFLAEALLAIIYKDIFGYNLATAAIDINHTLIDVETGVDCCMYDDQKNIIVLGEAKFYQKLSYGIRKIINNFTKETSFFNKLDNLKRTIENNDESCNIVLKQLSKNYLDEFTLEEFLSMNINFAGFVLHQHEGEISKYYNRNFYDNYDISNDLISNHIKERYESINSEGYSVLMIHLPINNKKALIKKVIDKAYQRLNEVRK